MSSCGLKKFESGPLIFILPTPGASINPNSNNIVDFGPHFALCFNCIDYLERLKNMKKSFCLVALVFIANFSVVSQVSAVNCTCKVWCNTGVLGGEFVSAIYCTRQFSMLFWYELCWGCNYS